ncbi:MAG: hypothetical protein AAGU05_11180, partial [Anaerolineaceae bacterium]
MKRQIYADVMITSIVVFNESGFGGKMKVLKWLLCCILAASFLVSCGPAQPVTVVETVVVEGDTQIQEVEVEKVI